MNLPKGTQIIPHDISKRMASESARNSSSRNIESQRASSSERSGGDVISIHVDVTGARGDADIERSVAKGVQKGISAYDRQVLPGRVNQINSDRRRSG